MKKTMIFSAFKTLRAQRGFGLAYQAELQIVPVAGGIALDLSDPANKGKPSVGLRR